MKKNSTFARKRFGQHFLSDKNIINKIISSAEIQKGDHIIEIGPGQGALTDELLKQSITLTAIEIDRDLADDITKKHADVPNFRLIEADVLKLDWNEIVKNDCRNIVIANLPYNISSPVFFKLTKYRKYLKSITIMIQKELAERITNKGDNKNLKDYGVLSVISNAVFEARLLFNVPPQAFVPQPKVSSSVIRLIPLNEALDNELSYFDFVRTMFNHRRKLMKNQFQKSYPGLYQNLSEGDRKAIETIRAENLSPVQYLNLFYRGTIKEKD